MGETVYKEMYNQELKEKFLNESYGNDLSRKVVANYFYVSRLTEQVLNRDLCDMSEDEIASVIKSLDLKTILSVKSAGSYIKNYITWAIGKNERSSSINPLVNVDDNWYRKLVNDSDASFWTREFIVDDVLPNLNDYQDKSFIMLLFEGVCGKRLSEIRNLKLSDINLDTNMVTVYDENDAEGREVELSENTIELLIKANGAQTYKNIYDREYDLVKTEYVFKKTNIGMSSKKVYPKEKMQQNPLINRLRKIQEAFEIPRFKAKNINKSGMLYEYYKRVLEKNNGALNFESVKLNKDLTKKEIENFIGKKFNWTLLSTAEGYTFYNTSQYKNAFLNLETVLKLYKPSEIKI